MPVHYLDPLTPYNDFGQPFRYWCQKTLPLVYDDSLSYYELLCKCTEYINKIIEDESAMVENIDKLKDAYLELEAYVNHYFDNLDVQTEINNKLDDMAESGDLGRIISNYYEPLNDVIIVSHSYGTTSGDGTHTVDPFTNRVKGYIENNTNRLCYIAAKNGAGFEDGNLLVALQQIENDVVEPNKVGLIIVCAGGNDAYEDIETLDIARGMANFTAYSKVQYPNAQLRLMWIDWRLEPSNTRPYSLYNETIRRYKYLGDRHGFGWIANGEYAFHQYYPLYYQPDGVHPTDGGETQLSDYVMEAIECGSVEVRREETLANAFTRNGSYPIVDCQNLRIVQDNGITTITPENGTRQPTFKIENITASTLFSEFTSSETALATFEASHLVKCNGDVGAHFQCTCVLTGTNHSLVMFGSGKIQNERLYISMYTDDNYLGASNYDTMNFFLPEITIPTMYC